MGRRKSDVSAWLYVSPLSSHFPCSSGNPPPSRVLKLTALLPGPFPRPLKDITMRLYSEKGTRPDTVPWLRLPGKAAVCLSPWLCFECSRLRIRHQFTYKRATQTSHVLHMYLSRGGLSWVTLGGASRENNELVSRGDRVGQQKRALRARSGLRLNCV